VSLILSDVSEMIARNSFNETWENFLPDLVSGLKEQDPIITMRVLRTLSPCLMKIRHSYRSDDLYKMINYVIENFCPQLTFTISVSFEI